MCEPTRVLEVHCILEAELWRHVCKQVHHGKTQVWTRGGICPEGVKISTQAARVSDPDAFQELGAPIGNPKFALAQFDSNMSMFCHVLGDPDKTHVTNTVNVFEQKLLGIGERSPVTARWERWACCLNLVNKRDPIVAQWMVEGLQHGPAACFQAVWDCQRSLADVAFEHPPSEELLRNPWKVKTMSACIEESWQK